MPYKKIFTEQEVRDIVAKWVVRCLKATPAQAKNPATKLQDDLGATSFALLDLIINLWEDFGLNFRKIPADHWDTVADVLHTMQVSLDMVHRLAKSDTVAAIKQFDAAHKTHGHTGKNK